MRKFCLMVTLSLWTCATCAGVGGAVVKGGVKTWDEIAKIALKVSGKTATEDAVKTTAKTIKSAALKYGDDVAEATMRGGVEVAEQALKRGDNFVVLLRRAGTVSDDAIKAIANNSDDVIKYASKYGDDAIKFSAKASGSFARGVKVVENAHVEDVRKMLGKMADEIPAEQISQVIGIAEKNPKVAKPFFEGIAKGGKYFVDKLFAVNAKQIMAGGLTVAMIEVALGGQAAVENLTYPIKARGEAIARQSETSMGIVKQLDANDQKKFVAKELDQTHEIEKNWVDVVRYPLIILVVFFGASLLVYVVRKTRFNYQKSDTKGYGGTETVRQSDDIGLTSAEKRSDAREIVNDVYKTK